MPATHLVRTVLPAPLSPQRAVTWPDGRSRSTWYRAWTAPKCLSSPRIWRSAPSLAPGSVTGAVMSIALSRLQEGGGDAAARCGGVTRLRDSVRRADRGCDLSAQVRCLDEVVLEDGVLHVGLVDPDRDEKDRRLLVALLPGWR